uniref:Protein kinase domain-containing protein n=1 Tax=Mesocestoides corti TaxID=53468 RepID=A0A5K3FSS2_MESCO
TGSGPLFFIYDLSSNGTFINRQKIGKRGKQPLKNNDEISLATMNYRCFMFVVLSSLQDRFPVAVTSKYTISRCLGSGACGEVYEVFGRESSQRYALKAVRKTTFPSSSENGHCNRVQSEVEILKKLNH